MSRLREQVLARRRRWLAARAVEAALVGGGAAALALAAQRMSGPASAGALAVALVGCGALAWATLLRVRWRDEVAYTRDLDARVGALGALATACEFARRADPEPLSSLLGERTAGTLERVHWRGAAAPPSALAAAALLAGLAVAAAVDRAPGPTSWSEVDALVGEIEQAAREDSTESAERTAAMARLQEVLATGRVTPAQRREVERRLERAGLGPQGRPPPSGGAPEAAAGGAEAAGGAGGGAGGGSRVPPLAADAGERTMSPPQVPPSMASNPSSAPGPDPRSESASADRASWPQRHDSVVERYLQRLPRD